MNLIDLLLTLQIPAWQVLFLASAGTLSMTYYKHRLERRVKELEYRLEKEAASHEKDLEFVQERHKKRLEALDEVNAALMEFDHALDHLHGGNSNYANRLKEYFNISRNLSRKYETLLGEEFYQAVKNKTDWGSGILQASFTLNKSRFTNLEQLDLPKSILDALRPFIGKPVPVTHAEQFIQGLNEQIHSRHRQDIFQSCDISQEFNGLEHHKAQLHLQNLKKDLLCTLPRPTSQVRSL